MHFFVIVSFLLGATFIQGFANVGYRSEAVLPSSVPINNHKWLHPTYRAISWPAAKHTSAVTLRTAVLPVETMASSSYLVRIVFLRAMAFVHMVAFLIAFKQNKALIGDDGITPARNVLDAAEQRGRQKKMRRLEWRKQNYSEPSSRKFSLRQKEQQQIRRWIGNCVDKNPRLLRAREILWDRSDLLDRPLTTLLWFAKDRERLNPWLDRIALTGLSVSLLVMFLGTANVPLVSTVCIHEDHPCSWNTSENSLHLLLHSFSSGFVNALSWQSVDLGMGSGGNLNWLN